MSKMKSNNHLGGGNINIMLYVIKKVGLKYAVRDQDKVH